MKVGAFLDLDNTICSQATEKAFALYLLRRKIIGFRTLVPIVYHNFRYNMKMITDYDRLKRTVIDRLLKNLDAPVIKQHFQEFFQAELSQKIYPIMKEQLDWHREKNHRIVIISSAIDIIVAEFANSLKADAYYSTELEISNGVFTGKVLGNIYYGKSKEMILRNYAENNQISLEKSYAYGDYYEDRFMLGSVGNPVAVNPDKKLKKLAEIKKWMIKFLDN